MSQVYALISNDSFRWVVQSFAFSCGKPVLTEEEMYFSLLNYAEIAIYQN